MKVRVLNTSLIRPLDLGDPLYYEISTEYLATKEGKVQLNHEPAIMRITKQVLVFIEMRY